MHQSSINVTVWVEDDGYIEQRMLEPGDGRTYRVLSFYRPDHRELVSLYLTVDQAQVLFEMLATATITSR